MQDIEERHQEADECILQLLEKLGCGEISSIFREIEMWYA